MNPILPSNSELTHFIISNLKKYKIMALNQKLDI